MNTETPASQNNSETTSTEPSEEAVRTIDAKAKDRWDKFQIVAALLIPASIALTGYLFSKATSDAERDSAKQIADAQEALGQSQKKISQAELLRSYLDVLTANNPQARKLAIEAILIALPDEGPRLVEIVAVSDPDESVKNVAKQALSSLPTLDLTFLKRIRVDNDGGLEMSGLALADDNGGLWMISDDASIVYLLNSNGTIDRERSFRVPGVGFEGITFAEDQGFLYIANETEAEIIKIRGSIRLTYHT